ncbi:MAG: hypothetical protein K1W19_09645 [Lachnospiraceae bacterium]
MSDKNITYNVQSGGQVNNAYDNSTMYVTQNNGIGANELENIIKGIKDNLSSLKKEDSDNIIDVVDMAREELTKPEPKLSRLRNCVSLIAPMFTIANGIPVLADNLRKLMDYINTFIG